MVVPVLGRDGAPLMPTHPARARMLLAQGRAVAVNRVPFVIRLKDRSINDGRTRVQRIGVGIDPGSKHTGMAVFRLQEEPDRATGEQVRRSLFALQLDHRGFSISKNLTSRSQRRRGRRSRNLRHRPPRFKNRARRTGWLPPSVQHRVDGITAMVDKLSRWFPVTELHLETARFDLQKLQNPVIFGDQYRHGDMFESGAREFVLERDGRACAYCGATHTYLNLDHVRPRSRGGSDRVSNLVLACVPCNLAKGNRRVEDFVKDAQRLARIVAKLKKPLAHAAAVNTINEAVHRKLESTGLPVFSGSGWSTTVQRHRFGLSKTHANDALAAGRIDIISSTSDLVLVAGHTGRGSYQRTRSDKYGFPRLRFPRTKQHFGFATGDLVRAVVTRGKHAGTHQGRVAVRSSGSFNITTPTGTVQGIGHKKCTLLQRANGYSWATAANIPGS